MENEMMTWAEVFKERLESIRQELDDTFGYSSKDGFILSLSELSSPITFAEYIADCEMDAFEDYRDGVPEWDDEAEKRCRTSYLPKIKEIAEEWEQQLLSCAEEYDRTHPAANGESMTEFFTEYFTHYWGRGQK